MALTWERLQDEPVIVCTFVEHVTAEDLREMYRVSAQIVDETGQHLYRVANYSSVTGTFPDVMGIVRDLGHGMPGSASDPRITPVLVGSHQWTRLGTDMAKRPQFGGFQFSIFSTVEDSLTALRLLMREVVRARELNEKWG